MVKGMGFGDRKRVTVNEFNSSTRSIVLEVLHSYKYEQGYQHLII